MIGVFLLLLIVGAAIYGVMASGKRRDGLFEVASRLNLSFNPNRDYNLGNRFNFFKQLHQGENRYASNVISGIYQQQNVLAFDFHYETTSHDKNGTHVENHWFSFFILTLPGIFPDLTIRREGLLTKVAEVFGYQAIKFESAEFSSAFCVRSPDKKFAYDVCNAQMMEYLLANRDLSIEIENQALALVFNNRISADRFQFNLQRLVEIRTRLPQYLFGDGGATVPPPLPNAGSDQPPPLPQTGVVAPPPLPLNTAQTRADGLQALATQLGFSSFSPAHDETFPKTWNFLNRLSEGANRYAFNVLQGTYQEQQLYIFDYHYETGSGKKLEHHYGTMLMLVLQQSFGQVNITPEKLVSRIEAMLDSKDVKFESADFSRAFHVHAPDKKIAYDVCNPEMIEYLLANRDLEIEIIGPALLLAFTPQLAAGEIEANLQRLARIRELLPKYLFENVGNIDTVPPQA